MSTRPPIGPPRPWAFPAVEREELATGVRLVTCPLPGRPMVAVRLVLPSGATAERADEAGVGLLATRGLSEGTEARSGSQVAVAVEGLGAEVGADIRWDSMVVRLDVPATRIAAALELLGEIVR